MGKAKRLRKERTAKKRRKSNDEYWKNRLLAKMKYDAELKIDKEYMTGIVKTIFDAWFNVFAEENKDLIARAAKNYQISESQPAKIIAKIKEQMKWIC